MGPSNRLTHSGKDKDRECPGHLGSVREGDVRTAVNSVGVCFVEVVDLEGSTFRLQQRKWRYREGPNRYLGCLRSGVFLSRVLVEEGTEQLLPKNFLKLLEGINP